MSSTHGGLQHQLRLQQALGRIFRGAEPERTQPTAPTVASRSRCWTSLTSGAVYAWGARQVLGASERSNLPGRHENHGGPRSWASIAARALFRCRRRSHGASDTFGRHCRRRYGRVADGRHHRRAPSGAHPGRASRSRWSSRRMCRSSAWAKGTWPTLRSTLEKMGVSETDFFRQCDYGVQAGREVRALDHRRRRTTLTITR